MHKELVLQAFSKAQKEEKAATGVEMSVTALSKKLSDYMFDECHFQYHEKSLRNKYNSAKNDDAPLSLKAEVVNCLCMYLGYASFADFVKRNDNTTAHAAVAENQDNADPIIVNEEGSSLRDKLKIIIHNNKVTLIFCSLFLLIYFTSSAIEQQRWMVWNHDHYEEVTFNADEFDLRKLKLYKEDRVQKFKRVTPDCSYSFFNLDGSENLWYGKSAKGELQFFTSYGLHPETGKTLKRITPYMIRKYICQDF